jgi:FtsZ-interacting cell division protein ZipA
MENILLAVGTILVLAGIVALSLHLQKMEKQPIIGRPPEKQKSELSSDPVIELASEESKIENNSSNEKGFRPGHRMWRQILMPYAVDALFASVPRNVNRK